ncbi:RNA-binding S4 domain-containing protein [Salinicoccus sp. ID82-1]|uniref:RQC P-site tRNA stabilizing factor n=1 Tax=Salinicoccus cyprini TaxID=2493691 RepID=A0A558ARR8_9STAP|nr:MULTISPECIES: RNA-binding S4 domain-containing protein [Salinicoccus]MCG1009499.1 RNA-binding S4 domain-containing protein [Salinicoccus sp. ID82-1]TVT26936.1 RNA-binding S4 domain-containing protein [Salinicoccus cyprini]
MRLDKFLKVSRVIKRRTLAKEISDDGRVKVNDRVAKAGTELSVGDIVEIEFGRKIVTLEVLQLGAHARKEDADRMYKVVKEQKIEKDTSFL